MADTPKVRFESKMLIDGKLVGGEAGTFKNVNPATEEVLGEVADASKADMHRAIDAARRAFDETDWSTNRAFRKRCLEQLQAALEAEREDLREELILEAGCPRLLTHGPQLDAVQRLINDARAVPRPSLAALLVVMREIDRLCASSSPTA